MSSCSQERRSASRTVFVTGAARARIQHIGCLVGACGLCLLCGALSPNHAWRIELLTRQERITELTHAVARRPHDSHEAFERLRTLFRDGNDGWHGFCKVVKNDRGQEALPICDLFAVGGFVLVCWCCVCVYRLRLSFLRAGCYWLVCGRNG